MPTWEDFSRGLWLAGPPEKSPPGTVRRGRGLHPVSTAGSARVRFGSKLVTTLTRTHTLLRFGLFRMAADGTDLWRAGGIIKSGLSGNRLASVTMPPTPGQADYCFVAGGGTLFKIDANGAITKWGIDAPTVAPTLTSTTQQTKSIEDCENAGAWTTANVTGFGNDATIRLGGAGNSIFGVIAQDTTATVTRTGLGLDLTTFPSISSPDEDWIEFGLRFSTPQRVESVQILFGNDANFNTGFSRELLIDDPIARQRRRGKRKRGLADVPGVSNNESLFLVSTPDQPFRIDAAALLGDTEAASEDNVWALLRIPKTSFTSIGDTPSWASITALRFVIRTNTRGNVGATTFFYIDNVILRGGVGIQGDCQYVETFKNSVTGARSNASPILTVTQVERAQVNLGTGPASSDPQVDTRELWRTVGNGAAFFKVFEQAIGLTTWTDDYADYSGLHSTTTHVLSSVTLPDDNDPPAATYNDAVGPHYGCMFWARAGDGRVYHSPAGRPESVEDFVIITAAADDDVQKLVRWNDTIYAFTKASGIWEIVGTTAPFLARKVSGTVGTSLPFTVAGTPAGIFYRGPDGVRRFDGLRSELVGQEALGPIFRGEAAEDFMPFAGVVGAFGRDEYYIGDEQNRTLAWDITAQRWRDVGLPAQALFFDSTTETMLLSQPDVGVIELDTPGTFTDLTAPIEFTLEPEHKTAPSGQTALVQYFWIELDTNAQKLLLEVLVDGLVAVSRTITTALQAIVEIPIGKSGRRVGWRLSGAVTAALEVVRAEVDVHIAGLPDPVPTRTHAV